jgi:hypothetical protein
MHLTCFKSLSFLRHGADPTLKNKVSVALIVSLLPYYHFVHLISNIWIQSSFQNQGNHPVNMACNKKSPLMYSQLITHPFCSLLLSLHSTLPVGTSCQRTVGERSLEDFGVAEDGHAEPPIAITVWCVGRCGGSTSWEEREERWDCLVSKNLISMKCIFQAINFLKVSCLHLTHEEEPGGVARDNYKRFNYFIDPNSIFIICPGQSQGIVRDCVQ